MKIVQTLFTKWMGFRTFFFCLEINLFHQIFFFKFCRAFRNWLHEEKNFGLMAYVWNFFVLLCCISRYLFFHNSLFGLSFLCISTLEPWLRKWRGREWPAHGLPIFHFTTMLTSFIIFRTIRIKVKFTYYVKATKFEKISHLFWQNSCVDSVASKQVGDFSKWLWPFQKSWTLMYVFTKCRFSWQKILGPKK